MDKTTLEQAIKSFGSLPEVDVEKGLSLFQPKRYLKNEYLIQEGRTCDWIAFIQSGIVRNFYTSSKAEEVTYCMTFQNHFISAYSSFISGEKTFENIHALTDLEVWIISKKDYQDLIQSSMQWLRFSNYFAEQSYILMEKRLLGLQMESADKRYAELLKNQPEILRNIPLKYIASYLGITQRHLSRLRSKIM